MAGVAVGSDPIGTGERLRGSVGIGYSVTGPKKCVMPA